MRFAVLTILLSTQRGFAASPEPALSTSSAETSPPQIVEPAISTASSILVTDPMRQNTLVEMWTRRMISPRSDAWSSEDLALLQRIREAEKRGALGLLREEMGTLRSYVVERRIGSEEKKLWLTKQGYDQYFFLKSQNARRYFEEVGTDAKFAFQIRDMGGKKIFNRRGLLTPGGEEIYDRILRGESVQWKIPNGEMLTNARRAGASK